MNYYEYKKPSKELFTPVTTPVLPITLNSLNNKLDSIIKYLNINSVSTTPIQDVMMPIQYTSNVSTTPIQNVTTPIQYTSIISTTPIQDVTTPIQSTSSVVEYNTAMITSIFESTIDSNFQNTTNINNMSNTFASSITQLLINNMPKIKKFITTINVISIKDNTSGVPACGLDSSSTLYLDPTDPDNEMSVSDATDERNKLYSTLINNIKVGIKNIISNQTNSNSLLYITKILNQPIGENNTILGAHFIVNSVLRSVAEETYTSDTTNIFFTSDVKLINDIKNILNTLKLVNDISIKNLLMSYLAMLTETDIINIGTKSCKQILRISESNIMTKTRFFIQNTTFLNDFVITVLSNIQRIIQLLDSSNTNANIVDLIKSMIFLLSHIK